MSAALWSRFFKMYSKSSAQVTAMATTIAAAKLNLSEMCCADWRRLNGLADKVVSATVFGDDSKAKAMRQAAWALSVQSAVAYASARKQTSACEQLRFCIAALLLDFNLEILFPDKDAARKRTGGNAGDRKQFKDLALVFSGYWTACVANMPWMCRLGALRAAICEKQEEFFKRLGRALRVAQGKTGKARLKEIGRRIVMTEAIEYAENPQGKDNVRDTKIKKEYARKGPFRAIILPKARVVGGSCGNQHRACGEAPLVPMSLALVSCSGIGGDGALPRDDGDGFD